MYSVFDGTHTCGIEPLPLSILCDVVALLNTYPDSLKKGRPWERVPLRDTSLFHLLFFPLKGRGRRCMSIKTSAVQPFTKVPAIKDMDTFNRY